MISAEVDGCGVLDSFGFEDDGNGADEGTVFNGLLDGSSTLSLPAGLLFFFLVIATVIAR
jgi:hypothetical protein